MKIFSKMTSNEYNNRLEKILDNKNYDEDVKNLLLSMLYKIENGYNDYTKVKVKAIPKENFMEKILKIIEEQCFDIKIVTPKTELSKPLEQENKICKIDVDRGSILVYANEEDLLYSLIKMNLLQEEYKKVHELKNSNKEYYEDAIKEFVIKGICLNESEPIRDFDGWSWNNNIKNIEDVEYNLIFQNIMMLNINVNNPEFYNKNFEKAIQDSKTFEKYMYIIILTLVSEQNEYVKTNIQNKLNELSELLKLMENKKKFLDKISENKKNIFNEIKKIDETINDKEKLRKEYDKRNAKLPNNKKIFSVSYLLDILAKEREEKLKEIKRINNFLDPSKFVKQKQKIENETDLLKNVVENLSNVESKKQTMINLQLEFLNRFEKQIEQNSNNKDYLEKLIYEFRYYCLIPIYQRNTISDVEKLQESIEKVMNSIIDNCIDKEIITNFSNSASLCYNILKYAFVTKIINLKEVQIKINKIKTEKYVNETKYYISISVCDLKELENVYNEVVYNLDLLNVKTNKKIPLFLKF